MLRFNTFRAARYLRSKFVEGKYLLASEATDLELELLDLLRNTVKQTLGDNVAIDDAWQVSRLSTTQLLIKPGEAWFRGLPFQNRYGKDELVSGAILSIGTAPVGVTITDDSTGLGKILTFNSGSTTPTNLYRIVVTAREELITDVQDPFLKNVNITEDTAQKIRLNFQLNIVPESLQTDSPIPYRDENSTSGSVTNFPNTGNFAAPNFANQVVVTPSSGQNGELLATNIISGSQGIDGRSVELTVRNNNSIGGGIKLPNSTVAQQSFANGTLVDSNGSVFYVNAIFNDTINTQLIIRIDQEYGQPVPQIVNGQPYTLIKRDVFVTDDVNGSPQGKLHWPISTLDWNQSLGFVHDSTVADLRKSILKAQSFQTLVDEKYNLKLTNGGILSWEVNGTNVFDWDDDIVIANAYGADQTIPSNAVVMLEGSALIYDLDLDNAGIIARGNLAITVLSGGTTLNLNPMTDLSQVRIGNIVQVGSETAHVIYIDNVSKQLELSNSISTTGSGTVYQDVFADGTPVLSPNSYVFSIRQNNKVWAGAGFELESGESNNIGDSVSQQLLTFIGATGESDESPVYSSTNAVTQGVSLTTAIGQLDAAIGDIDNVLATPVYDERILYPSGLVASTSITLPNNSRNSGNPQFYTPGDGKLQIYLNQLIKFAGIDYNEDDNQHISFNYNLPANAEVHFRIGTLGGSGSGGGGGGSGSLQDAYNLGNSIAITTGNPLTITGTGKLAHFAGDIQVDGVVDPTAIELTPQSSSPLSSGKKGIWVNNSNEFIFDNGAISNNFSQDIQNLQSGVGVNSLSRYMLNGSGSTIPAFTPVYSPVAGQMAKANGATEVTARVIGITLASVPNGQNGLVAYSGLVPGVTGFNHGDYVYLSNVDGVLTDVEPDIGTYGSGFVVIIVGLMDGNNLVIQIQNIGIL